MWWGHYVHEFNWPTIQETSQPLDTGVSSEWEPPGMLSNNQIQVPCKNIKSYMFLTADPPLQSQPIFVCLF